MILTSFLRGIFSANFFVASCGVALALFFDNRLLFPDLALLYSALLFAYTFLRGWGEIYKRKTFDKLAFKRYSLILICVGVLLLFFWYKTAFKIAPEWFLSGFMFLVYCFLRFRMGYIKRHILFHALAKVITVAMVWTMAISGFRGFQIVSDSALFFFIFGLMIPFEIKDSDNDKHFTQATLPQVLGDIHTKVVGYLLLLVSIIFMLSSHLDFIMKVAWSIACVVAMCLVFLSNKSRTSLYFLALVDGVMWLPYLILICWQWLGT